MGGLGGGLRVGLRVGLEHDHHHADGPRLVCPEGGPWRMRVAIGPA